MPYNNNNTVTVLLYMPKCAYLMGPSGYVYSHEKLEELRVDLKEAEEERDNLKKEKEILQGHLDEFYERDRKRKNRNFEDALSGEESEQNLPSSVGIVSEPVGGPSTSTGKRVSDTINDDERLSKKAKVCHG